MIEIWELAELPKVLDLREVMKCRTQDLQWSPFLEVQERDREFHRAAYALLESALQSEIRIRERRCRLALIISGIATAISIINLCL